MLTKLTTETIDNVLMHEWDPICVRYDLPASAGEYTTYAAEVWDIVVDAPTREEAVATIAAYLAYVRSHMMGLGGGATGRFAVDSEVTIARRLLDLSPPDVQL